MRDWYDEQNDPVPDWLIKVSLIAATILSCVLVAVLVIALITS